MTALWVAISPLHTHSSGALADGASDIGDGPGFEHSGRVVLSVVETVSVVVIVTISSQPRLDFSDLGVKRKIGRFPKSYSLYGTLVGNTHDTKSWESAGSSDR